MSFSDWKSSFELGTILEGADIIRESDFENPIDGISGGYPGSSQSVDDFDDLVSHMIDYRDELDGPSEGLSRTVSEINRNMLSGPITKDDNYLDTDLGIDTTWEDMYKLQTVASQDGIWELEEVAAVEKETEKMEQETQVESELQKHLLKPKASTSSPARVLKKTKNQASSKGQNQTLVKRNQETNVKKPCQELLKQMGSSSKMQVKRGLAAASTSSSSVVKKSGPTLCPMFPEKPLASSLKNVQERKLTLKKSRTFVPKTKDTRRKTMFIEAQPLNVPKSRSGSVSSASNSQKSVKTASQYLEKLNAKNCHLPANYQSKQGEAGVSIKQSPPTTSKKSPSQSQTSPPASNNSDLTEFEKVRLNCLHLTDHDYCLKYKNQSVERPSNRLPFSQYIKNSRSAPTTPAQSPKPNRGSHRRNYMIPSTEVSSQIEVAKVMSKNPMPNKVKVKNPTFPINKKVPFKPCSNVPSLNRYINGLSGNPSQPLISDQANSAKNNYCTIEDSAGKVHTVLKIDGTGASAPKNFDASSTQSLPSSPEGIERNPRLVDPRIARKNGFSLSQVDLKSITYQDMLKKPANTAGKAVVNHNVVKLVSSSNGVPDHGRSLTISAPNEHVQSKVLSLKNQVDPQNRKRMIDTLSDQVRVIPDQVAKKLSAVPATASPASLAKRPKLFLNGGVSKPLLNNSPVFKRVAGSPFPLLKTTNLTNKVQMVNNNNNNQATLVKAGKPQMVQLQIQRIKKPSIQVLGARDAARVPVNKIIKLPTDLNKNITAVSVANSVASSSNQPVFVVNPAASSSNQSAFVVNKLPQATQVKFVQQQTPSKVNHQSPGKATSCISGSLPQLEQRNPWDTDVSGAVLENLTELDTDSFFSKSSKSSTSSTAIGSENGDGSMMMMDHMQSDFETLFPGSSPICDIPRYPPEEIVYDNANQVDLSTAAVIETSSACERYLDESSPPTFPDPVHDFLNKLQHIDDSSSPPYQSSYVESSSSSGSDTSEDEEELRRPRKRRSCPTTPRQNRRQRGSPSYTPYNDFTAAASNNKNKRRAPTGGRRAVNNKRQRNSSGDSVNPRSRQTSVESQHSIRSEFDTMPEIQRKELETKAARERRVVFVGNFNVANISKDYLMKRFGKFGPIDLVKIFERDIRRKTDKERGYAFVYFRNKKDANAAIEKGNEGEVEKFNISFGARREFCKSKYKDLDENPESESDEEEEDLQALLQAHYPGIKFS